MKYREVEKLVIDSIKNNDSIIQAIDYFLKKISSNDNIIILKRLLVLDYKSDFLKISTSIQNILERYQTPKLKAFYFGMYSSLSPKGEVLIPYISGSNSFSLNNEDWAVNPVYLPPTRVIESDILNILPTLLENYQDQIEINFFPLWYLSITIGMFCKTKFDLFLKNNNSCYIAVGYDEGDLNIIGKIRKTEFKLSTISISKPFVLKKTATKYEFYAIQDVMKGAWFLDGVLQRNGVELVMGFAKLGKKIESTSDLYTNISSTSEGLPVDYTEEVISGPIVSERFMNLIMNFSNFNDIEFLPVTIDNYGESKFFIMNVLKSLKCLDQDLTTYSIKNYAKKIVLNKSKINSKVFRLKDTKLINNYIYISSDIKEAFERENISGLELIGIEVS